MFKKILLALLSQLYILGVNIRHKLFDWGISKSEEFDVPVICVGNITVGGTGKTPMCEMLIEHLSQKGRVAVISRGYGRKTEGYIEVQSDANYLEVGDEPLQMKLKYPHALIVVCEKRAEGIRRIIEENPDVKNIIMDDGFQHRYVEPKVNVIMVDATRPISEDYPLPLGTLRDSKEMLYRAQYFIVTKCPDKISPFDRSVIRRELVTMPYQKIYFTRIENLEPEAIYPETAQFSDEQEVIAMSGIGNPLPFTQHIKDCYKCVDELTFEDHHSYTRDDFEIILQSLNRHPNSVIITTEKDAIKFLMDESVPQQLRKKIYYTPIKMKFIIDSEEELLKNIDYDLKQN
ncbi:MAG: tetraacyldisaccharide 4'-kinase [Rikenellaceae bacterium]